MAEPGNDFKLIKAGLLIDGTGAPAITDGAVLIRGSQIEAVGPASVIPVPEGSGPGLLRQDLDAGHGGLSYAQ